MLLVNGETMASFVCGVTTDPVMSGLLTFQWFLNGQLVTLGFDNSRIQVVSRPILDFSGKGNSTLTFSPIDRLDDGKKFYFLLYNIC